MFDDTYFMKIAIKEAENAFDKGEIPIGAIVVTNNMIIAKAHNLTEQLKDVTAHAEIQAITSASSYLGGKYLKECTMYITLEPCAMCAGALYWSQIGKVVFGAYDKQRGFQNFGGKLHPKTEIISGVLENECSLLLQNFFSQIRK